MLTGRPLFQADSEFGLVEQVVSQEQASPARLQRGVSRDLETICLKCLQKEPGKRYTSAQDLAEDLRRFLRDEPFRARRTGMWGRGIKWARRRPTLAALAATAAEQPQGHCRELGYIFQQMREVLPIASRRHKVMLLLATGFMIVNSVLSTSIPVLFGHLINSLAETLAVGPSGWPVVRLAIFFLGLIAGVYLARELLTLYQKYLIQSVCTRIQREMTVVVVSHLFKADLATLARERLGSLHGRIARSVDGFIYLLVMIFTEFLPGLIAIACALAWVFSVDYRVGVVIVGVIPLFMALTLRQIGSQTSTLRKMLRSRVTLDGTVLERLGGLEYIRAAHTYRQEVDRVEQVAEEQRVQKMRYQLAVAGYECLKALNEGFFHLLVLGLGIYLAFRQEIQPGDIVSFSLLFYQVVSPLKSMGILLENAQDCSLRVDDLLQLLSEPLDQSFTPALTRGLSMMERVARLYRPKELSPQVSVKEPSLKKDAPVIAVSNLVVEYPAAGRPRRVLRGVSLTIRHGQTVGVTGPAGSGKSTWLKVLLRLTHPTAGEVFVGGVPLEGLSREAVGRLFGYVSQSPYLFAGTIEENIAYGSEGASPDAVRRAAKLASIDREIMAMPDGYQTAVAERGLNLSGGQRQRIALARVFLKDPPILILDEATAALDNISERAVQETLARARADRTVILVAHRLSTLRDADEILVFDEGRVVEVGPYEELVQRNGLFTKLVQSAGDGQLLAVRKSVLAVQGLTARGGSGSP